MTMRTRNAAPAPRQHVHVHSDSEARYWAAWLGCTAAELKAAVFAVGTPIEEIRAYLSRRQAVKCGRSPGGRERRDSFAGVIAQQP